VRRGKRFQGRIRDDSVSQCLTITPLFVFLFSLYNQPYSILFVLWLVGEHVYADSEKVEGNVMGQYYEGQTDEDCITAC